MSNRIPPAAVARSQTTVLETASRFDSRTAMTMVSELDKSTPVMTVALMMLALSNGRGHRELATRT